MPSSSRHLVSFDRTEGARADVFRPEQYPSLLRLWEGSEPLIVRGSGLSYCAAAIGPRVIDLSRFNRVLWFDEAAGRIRVEPGIKLGSLISLLAPRGWTIPSLPGHPQISVGGCVAFDVHGKAQHNLGTFRDYTESLLLVTPSGEEVGCSRTERPALFDLTLGGMGLTGLITEVTLKLRRLGGGRIRQLRHPVENLWQAAELMKTRGPDADILYSWNDLNRGGRAFGAGVVYEEHEIDGPLGPSPDWNALAPGQGWRAPYGVYGWSSIRLLNRAYLLLQTGGRPEQTMGYFDACFPIHGKEWYFSLFGAAGFREYQLVMPWDGYEKTLERIRTIVLAARTAVTLGSLKVFEGARSGLRFTGEGLCLAIDVPNGPRGRELFAHLDALMVDVGGFANISKDSRLSADAVRRMYPDFESFQAGLLEVDPERRMQSALRTRLGL